jgi:2-isopropylmalate synthase
MIQVYDTTLRDGSQRSDISFSFQDKLNIARRLDDLGVTFIEGGWPGSNPKDAEFFRQVRDLPWAHAKIVAFGSTCAVGRSPAEDSNILALIEAQTPYCTVVGKSSVLHVTEVLQANCDNNLRIIEESLAYLRAQGRGVIFDAEHFFDGYKLDAEYALETLKAAVRGGAEILVLCDTNGGSLPWEISSMIQAVKRAVDAPLGIHTHNDGGCAIANALVAIREGCIQVQGTINGYGERCGNADLCAIIPDLELKLGHVCLPQGHLEKLFDLSHYVAEVANLAPDEHLPYVGRAAFVHKGGLHVAGMRRASTSYQHVDPVSVGNKMDVVVSELSGRSNLLYKAGQFGISLDKESDVRSLLNEIKNLESRGFSFEAAEASVLLMLKRGQQDYKPPFELIDFTVVVEHRLGRGIFAEATVKIKVGDEVMHTVAEGNGPVNALDKALRKALADRYREINHFHLADYKVRILDSNNGTAATTRVLIDTRNSTLAWSTVGASANIIEASWHALADSVEYGLMLDHGSGSTGGIPA